jgi:hypothetical protein
VAGQFRLVQCPSEVSDGQGLGDGGESAEGGEGKGEELFKLFVNSNFASQNKDQKH